LRRGLCRQVQGSRRATPAVLRAHGHPVRSIPKPAACSSSVRPHLALMTMLPTATPPAPLARAATARSELSVIAGLLPFLRPYVGRIALALALIFAAKLANLGVPLILKHLVDGLNVEPSLLLLPVGLLLAYGGARIATTLFTELRQ